MQKVDSREMYLKYKDFDEITDFPDSIEHVGLPQALCLRFADMDDYSAIHQFLEKQEFYEPSLISALEDGRAVIFTNPFTKEVFGLATSYKILRGANKGKVIINDPKLSLCSNIFSQLMIFSLVLKEKVRREDSDILFDNKRLEEKFHQENDPYDYMKKAQNLKCIVSGTSTMLLHLNSVIEDIECVEDIKKSLLRRCG